MIAFQQLNVFLAFLTSAYVTVDVCLCAGAKEIDIAATLEHIRDQRQQMVKTKQQFELALAAVAEEVNSILKALPHAAPVANSPAAAAASDTSSTTPTAAPVAPAAAQTAS